MGRRAGKQLSSPILAALKAEPEDSQGLQIHPPMQPPLIACDNLLKYIKAVESLCLLKLTES